MKVRLVSFFIIILCFGCAASNNSKVSEPDKSETVSAADVASWKALIDNLPGVYVRGSGKTASVIVKVNGSYNNNISEPLFLINGVAYANNFQSIVNSINPSKVESFEVYKTLNELSIYGTRGTYGVIDIKLK